MKSLKIWAYATRKDVSSSKINDAKKTLEESVIELIKINPKITKIEMVEKTGKSKPTIERMLRKNNKIARLGSNRGGAWIIKE